MDTYALELANLEIREETDGDGRTLVGTIMRYGETVELAPGQFERFAKGSFAGTKPGDVVLLDGHDQRRPIGRGVSIEDRGDRAVMEFRVAQTDRAAEVLTLVRDDVVRSLSVGFQPGKSRTIRERGRQIVEHTSVRLREVSTVLFPAYPGAAIAELRQEPDQERERETMDTETRDEITTEITETREAVTDLEARTNETLEVLTAAVAEIRDRAPETTVVVEPEFTAAEVFEALTMRHLGAPIENRALADVVGDLGTADASGLSPDWYWANGLQHNTDRRRPMFSATGSAPFPTYGNNLASAKVTQETDVAARAAQKGAANSQALQVSPTSFPITWFDGAVDIALELISQSSPEVTGVVMRSLQKQYATATEADVVAKAQAAGTHHGAALDSSTYAALVADLILESNRIEDVTGLPGDLCAVAPTQWGAILGLMDGGDRRQFAVRNLENGDGSGKLTTRGIDIGGIFVYRSPAVTAAIQYNMESLRTAEKNPMTVAATNVELMGRDVGILGATCVVTWDEGITSYEV